MDKYVEVDMQAIERKLQAREDKLQQALDLLQSDMKGASRAYMRQIKRADEWQKRAIKLEDLIRRADLRWEIDWEQLEEEQSDG